MPSAAIQTQAFNPQVGKASNAEKSLLFSPVTNKSVTYKNRIVVPPMCMYSCTDGFFNDFHLAHYASFAFKGVAAIIIEATAVEPRGRISPHDAGLWSDEHIAPLKRVVDLIKSQGTIPAIQLAHAGRKANMSSLWNGYKLVPESEGGWPNDIVGPSDVPFDELHGKPHALTIPELEAIKQKWVDAAIRADKAGIEVLEVHNAHGYLLQSFLSGHSNKRTDIYGGSLENRMRYPLEVIEAVRKVWPEHKPLWVRISGTDFKYVDSMKRDEEGWDIYQSIEYAKALKEIGVDVIDVSGGGNRTDAAYPTEKLYQIEMSNAIKHQANIATAAVGRIIDPKDAETVLKEDKADYILVGRAHLNDSSWLNHAARELGVSTVWANQYERGQRAF
ncbi:hypothetical protein G6F46_002007 [Rhizopus delemar]|uniref:NADH:flavin oxidoreductase/NADH oxidase N-terminal domain-containing protein n=3 Tax=Rhizopus TaxID=4842 RepID=I1CMC8_RHIO9|nr:hypothetical protein RO3G_14319 [Rhizopus delemar RA 99-880]KAG1460818.1 hypothetical protein G6F55_003940 [Rhizopus delemar]KAG1545654.1 hypothetical protein G6F51_005336 [Rhizopus arrhizus]KAG1499019.1 hypothetical protein G6F54_004680 [Rhizopus delemar]KAG1514992.1 hypothetical protein G6F53_003257 [Rhizopus delemar]|eukprot:EIE89608.1 hypothetical protein RO3G_14319 [Rhizopus delemar RA 99-880]